MSSVYLNGGVVVPLDGHHDWFGPGVVMFERAKITLGGPAPTVPPLLAVQLSRIALIGVFRLGWSTLTPSPG